MKKNEVTNGLNPHLNHQEWEWVRFQITYIASHTLNIGSKRENKDQDYKRFNIAHIESNTKYTQVKYDVVINQWINRQT